MKNFQLNEKFDLGKKIFSEKEIIDFAKAYDPLEFHISLDAAKRSIFKGLVSSGPHPFHYFYKNKWVPRFGKSVLAGMGVDDWKFLKPVYANMQVHCVVTIKHLEHHPQKNSSTVTWLFEFFSDSHERFQHLDMIVLHADRNDSMT